jgi:t-SNARE complex subunit (syntaxin)
MVFKKKQSTPHIFEKYRGHMKYFKHLKNLLEAHETNKKSKAFENEYRQKQRELNYRLEHDRISGELENNRLPLTTRTQLEERKQKLLNAIKHHLDDLK